MIKVLIVYNSKEKSDSYKDRLISKYPWLKSSGLYKLYAYKLSTKIRKIKYDKIYFDEKTIKKKDTAVLEIIKKAPTAHIFWINLEKKKKLSSTFTSKIKQFSKKRLDK